MAIAIGAGTEIIRTIMLDDLDSTVSPLIIGEQHHIYTVLSIIVHAKVIQADGNWVAAYIDGYDAKAGTADEEIYLFQQDMSLAQTYVWNDKFSFNGTEPTDFTGPLSTVAMKDAIADQGSAVSQQLRIVTEHADDAGQVTVTYIDQNNA